MMDLLAQGKLSISHGIILLVTLLPSMISYALPFGFVSATLLTIGEITANQEFIALRSSGISPLSIFSSILFLASCGVLFSLAVNFYYAPQAVSKVKSKIQNIVREEPLRFVTAQKFIRDFPGYIIFVQSLEHAQLNDFHIWELDEHEEVASYIHALWGTLTYDEKKQALVLTLFQGTAEKNFKEGKNTPLVSFEKFSLDLLLRDIFKDAMVRRKVRHMTLGEMLALHAQSIRDGDLSKQLEVQTAMQTHCAMAFAILGLVLTVLPLSIQHPRHGIFLNVAIALIICLAYYFLMLFLAFLCKQPGLCSALMIWLPNIVLQFWGIYRIINIISY
jgi:lipopolysaccharide export system permease protein